MSLIQIADMNSNKFIKSMVILFAICFASGFSISAIGSYLELDMGSFSTTGMGVITGMVIGVYFGMCIQKYHLPIFPKDKKML